MHDKSYAVRWIVTPVEADKAGLYGTTTHLAPSPAVAALATVEQVTATAKLEGRFEFLILQVSEKGRDDDLLTEEMLMTSLRLAHSPPPCPVHHRPLC
jgi:hypothetical protein